MWILGASRKSMSLCDEVCNALERTTRQGIDEAQMTFGGLLAQLAPAHREHVASCEACRTFAADLVEVRVMFADQGGKPEPGPYFLTRVMASIAEKETMLERKAQTWAAVPRLAYRLSLLASLSLLIAGSWLYQMPKPTTVAGVNSQQLSEGLVDTGSTQDDVLLSAVGR